jgi:D-alanine-D-alanine ligase
MKKLKVAVIYGGCSGEHEISCMSAAGVLKNMDRNLFEPVPIAIDKNGQWFIDKIPNVLLPDNSALKINTDTAKAYPLMNHTNQLTTNSNNDTHFDVIFPVVHGVQCEDGTLQGLFEILNVPYVGANVISSALGMDKIVSKRLVSSAGISVAPFIEIRGGDWQMNPDTVLQQIKTRFLYPLFIKPCNTGSSVGVTKVHKENDLSQAIQNAFQYDQKIIVETALDIRDVELSVLENIQYGAAPRVSVAGEIVLAPQHEFYSYEAKYLDTEALVLDIPAKVSSEMLIKLQEIAKEIFLVLECEGMARVDLFIEKNTNKIYFNEINTIPGFTPYSMYPKLWEASGLGYQDLLTVLIKLAVARHERKQSLKRDWR